MKRVLAIGNFDGVHAGHRAIFAETLRIAKHYGATPAVLTFAPNPREHFFPATKPLNLSSLREKCAAIGACGIQEIIIARFDTKLAALPAEAFAKHVLAKRLHACHVVTGENFVFGYKRGGNSALLREWLSEAGVGYTAIPSVKDTIGIFSSSRVREALAQGDVTTAAQLLGRPYAISGRVVHGNKRGKTMGFPTLNLSVTRRFAPKFGVYAVEIVLPGGRVCKGVANVGIKPTFGQNAPRLEAHVFTPLPALYGQRVTVVLKQFLRPEQKFSNVKQLMAQIEKDVVNAKRVHASITKPLVD